MHDEPTAYTLIESQREFQEILRQAFAELAVADAREVIIIDPDFAGWPLGERAVVEHLAQWAMSHRKLMVLAASFDEVVRKHSRWVEWRKQWSHVVECRVADEMDLPTLPTMLLVPGLFVLRLAPGDHVRGSWSRDVGDIERAREQIVSIVERAQEAFPVTNLGL